MKPSRRSVLLGLGAAGLLPACKGDPDPKPTDEPLVPAPDRAPEPGPWDPGGSEDAIAFGYGVQAGDVTATSALLSIRTDEVGCELVVMGQDGDAWAEVDRISGLDPDGRSVQVEVDGLLADRAHAYVLFASDGTRRSEVGRFRTAPDSGTPVRKLVFGATSCWGSSNPDLANLGVAADYALDVMLLLGDTVYADGSVTLDDYRDEWDRKLLKEHVRALFDSTSVIATWDDHEVDNNWVMGETVSPDQYDNATAAFYEAIPMRVGPGGSGLWRTVKWGEIAEVFVMDSRGERTSGAICSDEQLDVMTEAIRASTAHFKLVLCSVHLTDHRQLMGPVEAQDRWQGYPDQRDRLVRACEETPGTIVITGDMHYSAVQLLGLPGEPGEDVIELAAGPAGSSIAPFDLVLELASEPVPQYLWMGGTWSVTVLTLDPGTGQATAEFLDDEGAVLYTHSWTP